MSMTLTFTCSSMKITLKLLLLQKLMDSLLVMLQDFKLRKAWVEYSHLQSIHYTRREG